MYLFYRNTIDLNKPASIPSLLKAKDCGKWKAHSDLVSPAQMTDCQGNAGRLLKFAQHESHH